MKSRYLIGAAWLGMVGATATAQTTSTYAYDPLGRLVVTSANGGPSGATTTTIRYDPAGNRTSYKLTAGSTPTPTQTPPASGPTALNPTLNYNSGGSYSIGLSTLASSSSPARITAFSVSAGGGTASVAGDGQSVNYTAPVIPTPGMCEPAETQQFSAPYTVQNTTGGQSASGTATIRVRGPAGPRPRPGQQCP
jgi:YD repeat-containing protein